MSIRVTEFTFLEHFSRRYGIPAPRHLAGTASRQEIKTALEQWGGQALVKPDVLTGRRGRAGSVVVVRSAAEAIKELKHVSGLEVEGKIPRAAYLVEHISAHKGSLPSASRLLPYLACSSGELSGSGPPAQKVHLSILPREPKASILGNCGAPNGQA